MQQNIDGQQSPASTRGRIVATADRLFYERGYAVTSFADIAEEVRLSRGNFYHHFKTKDAILEAVIGLRLARTGAMLEGWAAEGTAQECLMRFVGILIDNQNKIMRHGCPVGSLCLELTKLDHAGKAEAVGLYLLFRDWLARQFGRLGREAEAEELAVHLFGQSQGIAALALLTGDPAVVAREVERLRGWVCDVATKHMQADGKGKGRECL